MKMISEGTTAVNGVLSQVGQPSTQVPVSMLPPTNQSLDVWLGLAVDRIWAISQKQQNYKIKYVVAASWVDCRLQWARSGPPRLAIAQDSPFWGSFWRPRYLIVEEEQREPSMTQQSLVILGNGQVYLYQLAVSTMHCSLNFDDMPHDRHACHISFRLPEYSQHDVNFTWSTDPIKALSVNHLKDSEWDFGARSEWRLEVKPDRTDYNMQGQDLRAEFFISRRTYHMFMSNILPCILYWIISYLAIWVEATALPARAALHTLPVLMLANKLNAVQQSLPNIAYFTQLGVFLVGTLAMSTIQLFEFCVVVVAARLAKHNVAIEKVVVGHGDAEGGAAEVPMRWRIAYRVTVWIRDWLDTHSRWFFLLVYMLFSGIVLRR